MLSSSPPTTQVLTAAAHAAYRVELTKLIQQRKEVVERLKTAREMGDLSENGAYKYAKFELGNTSRRLREVRHILASAVIWRGPTARDQADFGAQVILENDQEHLEYLLVGPLEANPAQNKISLQSPLGSALQGKKVGQDIVVYTPRGQKKYTLLAISY